MEVTGVFILSCDSMYDMTVAFLESFRSFNPDIALMLIPYNGDIMRLQALAQVYTFAIFADNAKMQACDGLSLHFHEVPVGQYRKLLAWTGPYDKFIYIDIDTLILHNIDFVFDLLHDHDVVAAEANLAITNRFTWKVPPHQYFSQSQINYAANTGFIASRRGAISLEFACEQAAEAVKLKDYMELICTEQPLLNSLFIWANLRMTSLTTLFAQGGDNMVIPLQIWGGSLSTDEDSQCNLPVRPHPILMIHWAGVWRDGRHYANALWSYYRSRGEFSIRELSNSKNVIFQAAE